MHKSVNINKNSLSELLSCAVCRHIVSSEQQLLLCGKLPCWSQTANVFAKVRLAFLPTSTSASEVRILIVRSARVDILELLRTMALGD